MRLLTCGCVIALAGFLPFAAPLQGADHLDSPSVENDGRLDINDLYSFQSPQNPANTVLVMTVNPLAGILSPSTFNSRGTYEFHVDNNGDAVSDISFRIFFSRPRRGSQNLLVLREDNTLVASGAVGQNLAVDGGGQIKADLFDDPFFFDLLGFQDNLNFTGDDFFAGANVTAIVLEVPSASLQGPDIGVWARTVEGGQQFDRMGRPAINTVLIPSALKDAFNQGAPVNDPADFGNEVEATVFALSGDASYASLITSILLPDVLTHNTNSTDGFLVGRQLPNDVIDAELDLLTLGAVTGDGVDQNDVPFLNVFPYLAPSHP